jgi:pilus assembly protein CpaB
MKTKSLLLMCVAVGCGLVSMLGVKQFMNNNKSQSSETIDVLVATQSIASGVVLDDTNTEFKAYPVESLVEGVVTDREQVVELALKTSVYPGDFILEQKLGNKGDIGVASQIPPGMRLLSLKVDATTSHSGMMLSGHRVDVMCTYKVRSRKGMKSETKTVLQFIEVFATDNNHDVGTTDMQQASSKNVTLLMTPEEATKFLQAKDMANGNLHLALRSNSDTDHTDSAELDDSWLFASADDEEVETPKVPEAQESIVDQLQDELAPEGEQLAMVDPKSNAVAEMWQIEIFEGESRRIESVALPIEEVEESPTADEESTFGPEAAAADGTQSDELTLPSETEDEQTTVKPVTDGTNEGLKGMLQKFFTGA